ncbi:MAG: helix-turn-helix domain-containing protein [Lachnospiraceae bacterium]|nr:helix-turn-helix domain-containing protein [Lachnospiraceae bacterium]
MKETILSISEAAKQLQVESHVLRYWEDELDITIPRNEMGHRLYGPKEMRLLHTIVELKKQGFQLRAIKLLLHDLKEGEELDLQKLIAMREEINRRVEFLNEEGIEVEDSLPELIRKTLIQKQLKSSNNVSQFQISGEGKVTRLPVGEYRRKEETALSNRAVQEKSVLPERTSQEKSVLLERTNQEKTVVPNRTAQEGRLSDERVQQFQYIMIQIMNQALQDNTTRMTEELKNTMAQQLSHEFMEKLAKRVADQVDGRMVSSMSEQIAMSVEQTLGDHICDDVSTRIMKEMNYIARMQEEQEEAHYQKLDELLRERQGGGLNRTLLRQQKKQMKKEAKLVEAANEPAKKWKRGKS